MPEPRPADCARHLTRRRDDRHADPHPARRSDRERLRRRALRRGVDPLLPHDAARAVLRRDLPQAAALRAHRLLDPQPRDRGDPGRRGQRPRQDRLDLPELPGLRDGALPRRPGRGDDAQHVRQRPRQREGAADAGALLLRRADPLLQHLVADRHASSPRGGGGVRVKATWRGHGASRQLRRRRYLEPGLPQRLELRGRLESAGGLPLPEQRLRDLPSDEQTASTATRSGRPTACRTTVDGNTAACARLLDAAERARKGEGPTPSRR